MPLDIPDGSSCFVDANIFYYALVPTTAVSEPCIELLKRAMAGRLSLYSSVSVLSDAVHKVMVAEAAQITGRDRAGMVGYLGKHPEVISKLVEYPRAMERLAAVPMTLLGMDVQILAEATQLAVRHGLLTNDSAIVALMQRHRLTHLASNDDDFDAIADLRVWKPRW